jgi:hypothetical protein
VGGWFVERFRRVERTNLLPSPNGKVETFLIGGQSLKGGGEMILLLMTKGENRRKPKYADD